MGFGTFEQFVLFSCEYEKKINHEKNFSKEQCLIFKTPFLKRRNLIKMKRTLDEVEKSGTENPFEEVKVPLGNFLVDCYIEETERKNYEKQRNIIQQLPKSLPFSTKDSIDGLISFIELNLLENRDVGYWSLNFKSSRFFDMTNDIPGWIDVNHLSEDAIIHLFEKCLLPVKDSFLEKHPEVIFRKGGEKVISKKCVMWIECDDTKGYRFAFQWS